MKSEKIYSRLEKDFILPGLSDDWAKYMKSISQFLTKEFLDRSMGLFCDNTEDINKVFTAVFPSEIVMRNILKGDSDNSMFLVHHPMIWDIKKQRVFHVINKTLINEFKKRKISLYNLHVPLDNYGTYSTSMTLAKALKVVPIKPFARYFGGLCGIIGNTNADTINELKRIFESAVGHYVKVYKYGENIIKDNRVAIIAGCGNELDMLKEISGEKVNVLITGVSVKNDYSIKSHLYAKKNKINILGGTHYSTEKFSCIAICEYFRKMKLPCKFIEDVPMMEDM